MRACSYYTTASALIPKNGRPFNQLGVIALLTRRRLDALYYYARAIAAQNPLVAARESLIQLFAEVHKRAEQIEAARRRAREQHRAREQKRLEELVCFFYCFSNL